jgi:pyruvate/2-oxoacid:ferredoxin oxidoreductase alpha subunit
VAIGSSAAGARTYTATASQGLLFMVEAVYNASGLGLPIVMTVANRAIGAPINIWNDHSDSLSQRDCGWIQLFAETNQEALDLHIQAFKLAEELSLPVMVCMDGFILTHAYERVSMCRPRSRSTPSCRPTSRARCSTRQRTRVDRRHGRAGSLHGGALPRPRQADAGAGTDSATGEEFREASSAATPAA